jgi:hypothetical protein
MRGFEACERDSLAALLAAVLKQERQSEVIAIKKPELDSVDVGWHPVTTDSWRR